MCGSFTVRPTWQQLYDLYNTNPAKRHDPRHGELDLKPRFNVGPTQVIPVVRLDPEGERVFALLRWGLIPIWALEPP